MWNEILRNVNDLALMNRKKVSFQVLVFRGNFWKINGIRLKDRKKSLETWQQKYDFFLIWEVILPSVLRDTGCWKSFGQMEMMEPKWSIFDQKSTSYLKVWKFHEISITQILREINFEDSLSAKLAILTHSEALTFYFREFLQFM